MAHFQPPSCRPPPCPSKIGTPNSSPGSHDLVVIFESPVHVRLSLILPLNPLWQAGKKSIFCMFFVVTFQIYLQQNVPFRNCTLAPFLWCRKTAESLNFCRKIAGSSVCRKFDWSTFFCRKFDVLPLWSGGGAVFGPLGGGKKLHLSEEKRGGYKGKIKKCSQGPPKAAKFLQFYTIK